MSNPFHIGDKQKYSGLLAVVSKHEAIASAIGNPNFSIKFMAAPQITVWPFR